MTGAPTSPVSPFSVRTHVTAEDRGLIFDLLSSGGFFYPHEMAHGMSLYDEHLFRGENSGKLILALNRGGE